MTDRSDITISLDAVRGEVSKFDRIGAGLADLEREHPKDVICAVDTPDGWEQAIVARRAWREPRIALEKAREAAKRPVLELGRQIDAFAKDLKAKLSAGEDHYDAQIKAEEGRKEAEKQRRLQIEADRIAAARQTIVDAFSIPPKVDGTRRSAAELREYRSRFEIIQTDSWGDLMIEAQDHKARMLAALDEAIVIQSEREAAAAELARVTAAAAEERRLAREETARQQAQIDAQRAELDRRDAEARERERAVQEAAEAERRAQVAEAEQKMRAAHQAEIRIAQAAPEMRDCLAQWQAGERDGEPEEVTNARIERDRILSSLA